MIPTSSRLAVVTFAAMVLFTSPAASAVEPNQFTGRVVQVYSGTRFTVKHLHGQQDVVLAGVRVPDRNEPGSSESRAALAAKIQGQFVRIQTLANGEGMRRCLVFIKDGDTEQCLNTVLVQEGWARHDADKWPSKALATAEQEAREARRGLWGLPTSSDDQRGTNEPKVAAQENEHEDAEIPSLGDPEGTGEQASASSESEPPSGQPETDEERCPADGFGKRCLECGKPVPDHLGVGDRCPHCGVVWNYLKTELRCGSCGQRVNRFLSWLRGNTCPHCGARFASGKTSRSEPPADISKSILAFARSRLGKAIVAAVFLIAALVALPKIAPRILEASFNTAGTLAGIIGGMKQMISDIKTGSWKDTDAMADEPNSQTPQELWTNLRPRLAQAGAFTTRILRRGRKQFVEVVIPFCVKAMRRLLRELSKRYGQLP